MVSLMQSGWYGQRYLQRFKDRTIISEIKRFSQKFNKITAVHECGDVTIARGNNPKSN